METLISFWPAVATILLVTLVLWVIDRIMQRRTGHGGPQFRQQLIMLGLTFAGLLLVILALPLGDAKRGQIFSLLGILLSAMIALSSTTVLGNAMAGMMLRAVRSFRTGDFIQCETYFGRVSERGLFHTEVQNEDRQLITVPNLFLVNHPVTTVRSSGTIVAATVSLGYDVPRSKVRSLLIEAAERAELQDAFVQVRELGDFAVTYRIAGLLTDVKQLLTSRSQLRGRVMDVLHENGVEIVSPNFMNQRVLDPSRTFVPAVDQHVGEVQGDLPEQIVFDKAEEAASLEALQQEAADLGKTIHELESQVKKASDDATREPLRREAERLKLRETRLSQLIEIQLKKADDT